VYEGYWGLREKPFRKTPDPRFLFLNETYEEAFERLVFAVEEMELALLTGEVGSGKTLLTRTLVDRVGDRFEVGMILNPRLSPRQFLRTAALELGIAEPPFHANDLLERIHERLLALDQEGRAALLVVDEAHLIPGKPTFEEIRLLTNFQLDDRNLIAIVLVGQPELRERLRHRTYRAVTQRVGVSFQLKPLDVEDTRAYLAHRLGVAGAEGSVFSEGAVRLLHAASGGVPRLLNHLATQALVEGMARGIGEVDEASVRAVVEDDFATEAASSGRREAAGGRTSPRPAAKGRERKGALVGARR
jgi:type II secretory pathway predicted ATPase ExeA